jgi:hypothetical protein
MIIIDPYMLAVPSGEDTDAAVVREYVCRLMKWEREFSNQNRYVVSDFASQEIYRLGQAPTRSSLAALFDEFNITEYSVRDIVPTASGVLANAPRVEELAGLYDPDSDLLMEMDYVRGSQVVIPDEIRARLHPEVAKAFVKSLIYTSCATDTEEDPELSSVATAPLKEEEQATSEMLLECTIEKLSPESAIEQQQFSQEWPLLFDPQHLYATYDIVDFFYQRDPHMATLVAWCRMKADGRRMDSIDTEQFTFGPRFLDSLEEPSIQRRPRLAQDIERVFQAVVFVLTDLWPYGSDKHHALREIIDSRASSQQTRQREVGRVVHTERAARVEVIAGANCLHLHYWQCFDGSYEFANVTDDHDDPTICD